MLLRKEKKSRKEETANDIFGENFATAASEGGLKKHSSTKRVQGEKVNQSRCIMDRLQRGHKSRRPDRGEREGWRGRAK